MKVLAALISVGMLVASFGCSPKTDGDAMLIKEGSKVTFDYTLTVDGEVVDSSQGKASLEYTHGQSQIIPGLEKELQGLAAGDAKEVEVSPQEGYGEVNPEAFKTMSRSKLPEGITPEAGMILAIESPQGEPVPVKVIEVTDEDFVIDLNHPLAGKVLNFNVNIVSVD
jgi:FKBP-type peptidyl-prolyl cis-trans isomerase 2